MPGPISFTTEALIEDIKNYDAREYEEKYLHFHNKFNSIDDGMASGRVMELINSLIPSRLPDLYYGE